MKSVALRAIAKLQEIGTDRFLAMLAAFLVLLLLVQGLRYGCAARLGKGLAQSLASSSEMQAKRGEVKDLKGYDGIVQKGILGKVSKKASQTLFGILGDSALFGTSAKDAKPYKVGAEIPGGEKIVEVSLDEVVLEKDGKQRTVKVFPDVKAGSKPGSGPKPPEPPEGAPAKPAAEAAEPPAEEQPEEQTASEEADKEESAERRARMIENRRERELGRFKRRERE